MIESAEFQHLEAWLAAGAALGEALERAPSCDLTTPAELDPAVASVPVETRARVVLRRWRGAEPPTDVRDDAAERVQLWRVAAREALDAAHRLATREALATLGGRVPLARRGLDPPERLPAVARAVQCVSGGDSDVSLAVYALWPEHYGHVPDPVPETVDAHALLRLAGLCAAFAASQRSPQANGGRPPATQTLAREAHVLGVPHPTLATVASDDGYVTDRDKFVRRLKDARRRARNSISQS